MQDDGIPTRAVFPSTCWSRMLGTRASRADLELLAQAYWRPVYGYVRTRWQLPREMALDRTQDFFVWLLESDVLRAADRGRGRFRAFVKTALNNYLIDRDREDRTLKRGGGQRPLSLSVGEIDEEFERGLTDHATPEDVLDAAWRRELVTRALAALERELSDEGKPLYYAVFRDWYLSPDAALDHKVLAARYDLGKHDVTNYLRKAKQRYRARLRSMVCETVVDEAELEAELAWFFGS